ncbi:hypothetical protein YOLOSWAG_145 [Erwinia phage vB_EamM_Yoloswag]|uniref:Uncharacterized protein n=1 Tax=Erwinia phage vB_EamM_Yoloswag TaxID=1958956 RepID=A0A1S6L363_9CAUD|nr:hypothetical protein HOR66_gp145 [Erwinia phage vB_EamM_Yoloswag]AQT28625.1 hypothetical protein YOLOSWAG_145 [Erwinia phage vB_EamM_Yoloswag]
MLAQPCLFDYWRNYVPYAPDLSIPVKNSEETRYSLAELLLQGSRDHETGHSPTEGILDKVPVQRGWRLNAILISNTVRGDTSLNLFGDEIIYRPRSGYIGVDCCNYALTNGTQQSAVAQINFQVYQWYQYFMQITKRYQDGTRNEFYAKPTVDFVSVGLQKVLYAEFRWYYNQYVVELDARGVKRAYKRRTLVQQTIANSTGYNGLTATKPTVINQYDKVTFSTYFDTSLGQAFDGDTNVPFSPFGSQGDVEVEISLYCTEKTVTNPTTGAKIQQVDLSVPINLIFRASDIYGARWWESGNILV